MTELSCEAQMRAFKYLIAQGAQDDGSSALPIIAALIIGVVIGWAVGAIAAFELVKRNGGQWK
ncbi:hypothetical protein [Brucella sp. IR073]|uniref:hypothetical protein n=1 Tax=unclassified Brucella TaxID=2632610 RepID=UPI003B980ED9